MPRTALPYLTAALALACSTAVAAPGDLDLSFGTGGKVLAGVGGMQSDYPGAIAIDAAGNLVVAGVAGTASGKNFGVLRLLSDGQPDPAFGDDGRTVVDFGDGTNGLVSSIAIDDQGRIHVAGAANPSGRYQFAAVRLLPEGTLDGGYGNAGRALVDNPTPANDNCNGIALGTGDSLYLAGSSFPAGAQTIKLARLGADGNPGGFGYVVAAPANSSSSTAVAVMPGSDGGLYVAATINGASGSDMALVKYDADGAVDAGFHDGGASHAGPGLATSMAREEFGSFFLVGTVFGATSNEIGIARLDATGTPADGFGNHGFARIALPGATVAGVSDVKLDADGDLYVTTPAYVSGRGSMTIVAHVDATTGAPIASFGDNGVVAIDMGDAAYGGAGGVVDAARRRFCFAAARQDSTPPALFAVGCVRTAATDALFRSGFD